MASRAEKVLADNLVTARSTTSSTELSLVLAFWQLENQLDYATALVSLRNVHGPVEERPLSGMGCDLPRHFREFAYSNVQCFCWFSRENWNALLHCHPKNKYMMCRAGLDRQTPSMIHCLLLFSTFMILIEVNCVLPAIY